MSDDGDDGLELLLAHMRKLFTVPPCEVCGQPGRLVSFGDVSVYLCPDCTPDDRKL
jgi:hypothetical protein